ncbi:hypothetical protein J6590_042537 [Homalodisca vitripennis]|nr:hypothetical protein J6590_042537 [Homalodisca vitripennis]
MIAATVAVITTTAGTFPWPSTFAGAVAKTLEPVALLWAGRLLLCRDRDNNMEQASKVVKIEDLNVIGVGEFAEHNLE